MFVAFFIIRYIKAGSPRLSVIILIALLFFPLIPVLAALVISADVYHISTPTGVDVLCWVSTCVILWPCGLEQCLYCTGNIVVTFSGISPHLLNIASNELSNLSYI